MSKQESFTAILKHLQTGMYTVGELVSHFNTNSRTMRRYIKQMRDLEMPVRIGKRETIGSALTFYYTWGYEPDVDPEEVIEVRLPVAVVVEIRPNLLDGWLHQARDEGRLAA